VLDVGDLVSIVENDVAGLLNDALRGMLTHDNGMNRSVMTVSMVMRFGSRVKVVVTAMLMMTL
jgi:hypothetical protein